MSPVSNPKKIEKRELKTHINILNPPSPHFSLPSFPYPHSPHYIRPPRPRHRPAFLHSRNVPGSFPTVWSFPGFPPGWVERGQSGERGGLEAKVDSFLLRVVCKEGLPSGYEYRYRQHEFGYSHGYGHDCYGSGYSYWYVMVMMIVVTVRLG
eukprot:1379332-Amorphochlora_amoeboformis.AAC.1